MFFILFVVCFFWLTISQWRRQVNFIYEIGYTLSLLAILISLALLGYFRWVCLMLLILLILLKCLLLSPFERKKQQQQHWNENGMNGVSGRRKFICQMCLKKNWNMPLFSLIIKLQLLMLKCIIYQIEMLEIHHFPYEWRTLHNVPCCNDENTQPIQKTNIQTE